MDIEEHIKFTGLDKFIKELVWKLDREVWAHVPNPNPSEEWTTSKAREETRRLIIEYVGEIESHKRGTAVPEKPEFEEAAKNYLRSHYKDGYVDERMESGDYPIAWPHLIDHFKAGASHGWDERSKVITVEPDHNIWVEVHELVMTYDGAVLLNKLEEKFTITRKQ